MVRVAQSFHPFALVIVRKADRFLMIQERNDEQGWYFPAGGVDPGETFAQAACRETREEAGLEVRLRGIYRIEHRPEPGAEHASGQATRMRVFFAATVVDDHAEPKSFADEHSLGAAFLTLEQLQERALRGDEVIDVLTAVEAGAHTHPLAVLSEHGRGWHMKPRDSA